MLLFLADESPQLVKLQMLAREISHLGIKQFRASLTDTNAKPHDRVAVNACHTFRFGECRNPRPAH
jgi:hypothetical protein